VKDDSIVDGVLAMQTLLLAEETNDVYQDIKSKMGNPLFKWSFDWNFELTKEDYDTILTVVFVMLILYIFSLSAKVRRLERRLGMRRKSRVLR